MRKRQKTANAAEKTAEEKLQNSAKQDDNGKAEKTAAEQATDKSTGKSAEQTTRNSAAANEKAQKFAKQDTGNTNDVRDFGFRPSEYRLQSLRRANRHELWQRYLRAHAYAVEHAKLPHLERREHAASGRCIFADGCGFYKLFWIFVLGSFLGDVVETLWCRFRLGEWMSRSSLVFGQFSIVWGLGCFLLTLFLHRLIDKDDRYIFAAGTILGGAFEYTCSVFTEKVFGCVFWDYSKMTFNLNGRINLLYCFFWGIIAIIWLKVLYPWMSKLIERMPVLFGKILTWILVVFFFLNICVSTAALYRMRTRDDGIPAANWAERYADKHFSDEWLEKRYRNLKLVDENGKPQSPETLRQNIVIEP